MREMDERERERERERDRERGVRGVCACVRVCGGEGKEGGREKRN